MNAPFSQVVIPLSLQRRVEGLLQEHLDRMLLSSGKVSDCSDDANGNGGFEDVNPEDNPDSLLDGSVMEKVLQRRSLRMRNMQRAWQVWYLFFSCTKLNFLCDFKWTQPWSMYLDIILFAYTDLHLTVMWFPFWFYFSALILHCKLITLSYCCP